MNKKNLREYFSFSRKERNGVMILVLLVGSIFILPYVFPGDDDAVSPELLAAIQESTSKTTLERAEAKEEVADKFRAHGRASNENRHKAELFAFDPNTLSAAGWMKLGLKSRTVETIEKYLSRGGSFTEPGDLRKIFGLSPVLAEQLIPYVTIRQKNAIANKFPGSPASKYEGKKTFVASLVNINTADSLEFVSLNGIGPTLASRIIKFRDKLGGFNDLKQLSEVYGLQDSTYQKLVPRLTISGEELKKIDINDVDVLVLGQHPYIGRKIASVIIAYRNEHGKFTSMEELEDIKALDKSILIRISPYLSFNE